MVLSKRVHGQLKEKMLKNVKAQEIPRRGGVELASGRFGEKFQITNIDSYKKMFRKQLPSSKFFENFKLLMTFKVIQFKYHR